MQHATIEQRPDLLRQLGSSCFHPTTWRRSSFADLDIVAVCDGWQGCWAGVVYRQHKRWMLSDRSQKFELWCVLVPEWPGLGRFDVDVVVARLKAEA